MKTIKPGKRISLSKERIVSLSKEALCYIKGGGKVTLIGCPPGPLEPTRPSDVCAAIQ